MSSAFLVFFFLLFLLSAFSHPHPPSADIRSAFYRHPAKIYSALSFDRINFFNMANLFLLSRKAFVMCYCFRAPIKTFFFDTCQMTVKSCVLHLFPVSQTGRSHIINILLALFFSVRTVNYGSSFLSIDLWPARFYSIFNCSWLAAKIKCRGTCQLFANFHERYYLSCM